MVVGPLAQSHPVPFLSCARRSGEAVSGMRHRLQQYAADGSRSRWRETDTAGGLRGASQLVPLCDAEADVSRLAASVAGRRGSAAARPLAIAPRRGGPGLLDLLRSVDGLVLRDGDSCAAAVGGV